MTTNLLNRSNVNNQRKQTAMVQPSCETDPLQRPELPDSVAQSLVGLFKLFSDQTRLRILFNLMHEHELNVRTLCGIVGQSQPAVSHHLALLREAKLIDVRRDGKHNFYRIVPDRFQELLEMMFSVSPKQEGRIVFETFLLSYKPIDADAAVES